MSRETVVFYAAFCLGAGLFILTGCGSGSSSTSNSGSGSGGTKPTNPVPTLASFSPSSATAGSAALTITVKGTNFISTSAVKWNDTVLATTYSSATSLTATVDASYLVNAGTATITVVNPNPGGGVSGGATFTINSASAGGVTTVDVAANSLAWDPLNQVIYLSLPSLDGANGNTVQILDPATGALGASAFAGSEPNLLSVSATSKYLYVSLNGSSNVQRMTLPNLGTDIEISLGPSSFYGPYFAMDMQAAPNSDDTVAVVRGVPNTSPEEEGGVLIYDDATVRPNVLCGWIQIPACANPSYPTGLYDSIQWNADGSDMYIANYEDTAFDFYSVPVTASGFGTVTDYAGLVPGFFALIHYDATTKYVYDEDGEVIDPNAGQVIGTFAASGLMVPDGASGTAFFLGQTQNNFGSSTYTLESFDIHKFTPIATLTISNVVGTPTHLIRWGTDGLAFTTENSSATTPSTMGAVYLISGTFVSNSAAYGGPVPEANVQRSWKDLRPFGSAAVSARK